jgi:DNA mismatch repair ATPase MutS
MNKFFKKWVNVKTRHNERVVLVPASVFYITFNEDAEKLHEFLGLELNYAKNSDKGFEAFARFTRFQLEKVLHVLENDNQSVGIVGR